MINILLIDCSSLHSAEKTQQNNLSFHPQAIQRYFNLLREQKHPHLHIASAIKGKIKPLLDSLVRDIQPELLISFPFSLEVETLSEQYKIPYYGLEHIAPTSKRVNKLWLRNQNIISFLEDNISRIIQNGFPLHNIEDQHNNIAFPPIDSFTPQVITYTNRTTSLEHTPLANEPAFYSRFQPLPTQRGSIFYKPNVSRWLLLMDDALDYNNQRVLTEIATSIMSLTAFTNVPPCVIIFGNRKRTLLKMKKFLSRLHDITIEIVQDHFSFMENSILSMIQKCDAVITSQTSTGLDAISLSKPVVFISSNQNLTKFLDSTWCISNYADATSSLLSIGNIQCNLLNYILSELTRHGWLLNNHSYNSLDLHSHLISLLKNSSSVSLSDSKYSLTRTLSEKCNSPYPIATSPYNRMKEIKKIYLNYRYKQVIYKRKFDKFQKDPKAFCKDSKFILLRLIAPFL